MSITSLQRFSQRTLALSFAAAVMPLLALAAITYLSTQRSIASTQWIIHTEEVLRALDLLRAGVSEAESAARAYALTGEDANLRDFQSSVDRSGENLKTVRQLTVDNPRQQHALDQIEPFIADKLALMRNITALRRTNDTPAAIQLMRTRVEPLSNEIHRRLQAMTDEERRLLAERFVRSAADVRNTARLRQTGFVVSLLILFTTFWFLSRSLVEHKRLEAQRETFFHVSLDMLCFAGFDGYFKRLNPAWENTLGYTVEELMAAPYIDLVHPDDRESTLREAATLASGGAAVSFENRYRCKDGSYKWLLWNAVPAPDEQIIYAAAHDLTERKRAEAQLHALSLTDDLTNLRNRRGFLVLAEQELKLVRDRRRKDVDVHLWLIFADIDGLKRINDRFGHDAGSRAIVQAADLLTDTFRDADVIARLGGDEFAILALNNNPAGGQTMVARLEEAIDAFNDNEDLPYRLSLSLGVVKVDAEQVASIEEVLREADQRMYEHKRGEARDVEPGAVQ